MPGIIFTSRYIRNAGAGQVKNLLNYMATRPNAEKLSVAEVMEPTKRQREWIAKEIKKQPGLKSLFEYEDYVKNPTQANASELIEKIAEQQIETAEGIENYVGYLAKRPRAERGEQGHALWNGSDKPISLKKAIHEAAEHRGRIWTHVVSLRREDAERLGYDNAETWRALVKEKSTEMAKEMGIPLEDFVWYGAFHNEGHHPHIHIFCYSKKPKQGYLSNRGIRNLRRSFASEIFRDDLLHIYERKDEVRKEVKDYFSQELKKASAKSHGANPRAEALLLKLAANLKTAKHKKVYGRLDKENKILVDEIVREISRDKKVSAQYESWLGLKDEILSAYRDSGRARKSLADEPEFRNIKNMALKCALELSEQELLQDGRNAAQTAFLRLLKNISRIIEEDFERQKSEVPLTDKKLLRKLLEKELQGGTS